MGDFLIQKVLEDPEFRGFDQDTGNYNSFWLVERELDKRTSLIIDPPNGRMPAMKPAAMKRLGAAFGGGGPPGDMETLPAGTRCISYGVPNTLAGYNSYFKFIQTEHHVTIQQELIHHARIIPIDDRPALDDGMQFWNGDARGYWDGDSLVVETQNYNSQGAYRGATENLRVVERFTRVGKDTIEWEITYRDDETWESPWTMMIPLERTEDKIYEYACHEGNHSMTGIMAGSATRREGSRDWLRRLKLRMSPRGWVVAVGAATCALMWLSACTDSTAPADEERSAEGEPVEQVEADTNERSSVALRVSRVDRSGGSLPGVPARQDHRRSGSACCESTVWRV